MIVFFVFNLSISSSQDKKQPIVIVRVTLHDLKLAKINSFFSQLWLDHLIRLFKTSLSVLLIFNHKIKRKNKLNYEGKGHVNILRIVEIVYAGFDIAYVAV